MLGTFSLHTVVNDVGAYCGLAALVGLALMILLYFAQARELRRLSDWIEDEQERRQAGPVARVLVGTPAPPPAAPPAVAPPVAAAPPAPPPAAVPPSGTVSTAVPGVRRVALPGAGAATPAPVAVLAPATAAALAAAPAPGRVEGEEPGGAGPETKVVAIPVPAPTPNGDGAHLPPGDGITPAAEEPANGERSTPGTPPDPHPAAEPGADAPTAAPAPGVEASAVDAPAADDGPPTGEFTAAPDGDDDPAPAAPERPAAVPLSSRRLPTAEPRRVPLAGGPGGAPPSALDLLRAEPRGAGAELPRADTGLRPLTPPEARPRFPPAPPVRAQPLRDDDVTVRVPGRGAPGVDQTEPRRRKPEPDADYADPPRSFGATLRLLAAAIVIVAILIFVATRIFASGSSTPPAGNHAASTPSHTSSNPNHTTGTTPTGVVPSRITVAVLNGTTKAGLAGRAWTTLAAKGFVKGAIANAPSQSVATSTVGYTHSHRKAALAIAQDLSISTSEVAPVDGATLTDAERNGPRPKVVVTLGADYAG